MKSSIRVVCGVLACVSANFLAVPGYAQGLNKAIKKTSMVVDRLNEEAKAAAAKAKALADAQIIAEKAAADLLAGITTPEAKAAGAKFTPAIVKPYLDILNTLLADSKSVTTPAQAAAFLDKFRSALPRLTVSHDQAMNAYVDFDNSGVKTSENLSAEKMLAEAGTQAEAIDADLTRVEKIHDAAKIDFQKFRDLYN